MVLNCNQPRIAKHFSEAEKIVIHTGDCRALLATIPDKSISLVVTSPPYNLGKSYEKRHPLKNYIEGQSVIIGECYRVLKDGGSICWQVGNYVDNGEIVPLDSVLFQIFHELGLKMRNRIVWHFEHGLHCSRRFSGRYEVIMWFTKGDSYHFDVDPVRVPQKYPGKKYFKGPKAGQYSCNPLGKNPGDLWIIPNVKSNHVEKTEHPCQFPVELIERLVLSLTTPDDWVLDPFMGVGSSIVAALRHGRRGVGAEIMAGYATTAKNRILSSLEDTLPVRPMHRPVFDPDDAGHALRSAPWLNNGHDESPRLLDRAVKYNVKSKAAKQSKKRITA